MRWPQRTSLGILLLYSLALISPQQADVALPSAEACASSADACPSTVLSLRSHTGASASWALGFRALIDAGRPLDVLRDPSESGGLDAIFAARNERNWARASASTREHRAISPAIREAGTGLVASPPRAPPVSF